MRRDELVCPVASSSRKHSRTQCMATCFASAIIIITTLDQIINMILCCKEKTFTITIVSSIQSVVLSDKVTEPQLIVKIRQILKYFHAACSVFLPNVPADCSVRNGHWTMDPSFYLPYCHRHDDIRKYNVRFCHFLFVSMKLNNPDYY